MGAQTIEATSKKYKGQYLSGCLMMVIASILVMIIGSSLQNDEASVTAGIGVLLALSLFFGGAFVMFRAKFLRWWHHS